MHAFATSLLLLSAAASPDSNAPEWKLQYEQAALGLKVYNRPRADVAVKELKAVGTFDEPVRVVRDLLMDPEYVGRMAYVAEFRIVQTRSATERTTYTRLKFPIIDDRDYFLSSLIESELNPDGSGVFRNRFMLSPENNRPERRDVVRVRLCEGYWELEGTENGTKTRATYYLLTHPAGWIPAWMSDGANSRAMPDLFKNIDDELKVRRQSASRAQK